MSEYAVTVDHIWKRFHKGEFHDSLRDAVPAFFRNLLGRGTKDTEIHGNIVKPIFGPGSFVFHFERFTLVPGNHGGKCITDFSWEVQERQ